MIKLYSTIIMLWLVTTISAQDITTFPYETGFEGAEGNLNENFPEGWTAEDLNSDGLGNQGWQIIKNSPLSVNARTDSTAVHMFSNLNEVNDDWLFTPSIQLETGFMYRITYWYKVNSIGTSEKFKVHFGETANGADMAQTEILELHNNLTNTEYQQGEAFFYPETAGMGHFGFHYHSDAFQFILLLDDIRIERETEFSLPHLEPEFGYSITNHPDHGMQVNFETPLTEKAMLSIIDIQGREVHSEMLHIGDSEVKLHLDLAATSIQLLAIIPESNQWIIREKILN